MGPFNGTSCSTLSACREATNTHFSWGCAEWRTGTNRHSDCRYMMNGLMAIFSKLDNADLKRFSAMADWESLGDCSFQMITMQNIVDLPEPISSS